MKRVCRVTGLGRCCRRPACLTHLRNYVSCLHRPGGLEGRRGPHLWPQTKGGAPVTALNQASTMLENEL